MQIIAEQANDLHTYIAVITEECQQVLAFDVGNRGGFASFGRDLVFAPANAFAEPEHGPRTGKLDGAFSLSAGGSDQRNFPTLNYVNPLGWTTLFEKPFPFAENAGRGNGGKRIPYFRR